LAGLPKIGLLKIDLSKKIAPQISVAGHRLHIVGHDPLTVRDDYPQADDFRMQQKHSTRREQLESHRLTEANSKAQSSPTNAGLFYPQGIRSPTAHRYRSEFEKS
jgi:hypothetical protein